MAVCLDWWGEKSGKREKKKMIIEILNRLITSHDFGAPEPKISTENYRKIEQMEISVNAQPMKEGSS